MGMPSDLIIYGNRESNKVLLQVTGDHELDRVEKECDMIKEAAPVDFCMCCLRVSDWNKNLAPWQALTSLVCALLYFF